MASSMTLGDWFQYSDRNKPDYNPTIGTTITIEKFWQSEASEFNSPEWRLKTLEFYRECSGKNTSDIGDHDTLSTNDRIGLNETAEAMGIVWRRGNNRRVSWLE